MRAGWPTRCGGRVSSASTFRRRRFASCAACRHQLVRLRARLVQTIRALLLRQDAGEPSVTRLYSARGIAWLQGRTLPGASGETLQRLTRTLIALDTEAQAADAAVRAGA
jgi:transposase